MIGAKGSVGKIMAKKRVSCWRLIGKRRRGKRKNHNSLSQHYSSLLIERCNLLMERERLYLDSNLTIVELAKRVGTNRSYLSLAIKRHHGSNYCCYINRLRVKWSIGLIEGENKSDILELALLSGFGSAKTYVRQFSAIEGVSPIRYIRAVRAREGLM